MSLDIEVEKVT
ncbi:hypothetical protein LINPERPRIM_LOCUS41164 [Linum perenne]